MSRSLAIGIICIAGLGAFMGMAAEASHETIITVIIGTMGCLLIGPTIGIAVGLYERSKKFDDESINVQIMFGIVINAVLLTIGAGFLIWFF